MKVLFCKWGSICERGMIEAFRKLGHEVYEYDRELGDVNFDTDYLKTLATHIQENRNYNMCFTINFVPIIARACKIMKLPYVSYTVDCPLMQSYSDTVSYETNILFMLDREQAQRIELLNPGHVFHMPLAFDIKYDETVKNNTKNIAKDFDVTFVGKFYDDTNKEKYDQFVPKLPEYMRGYADALIQAQLNVYGYNLIEDSITDEWIEDFIKASEMEFLPDYNIDAKYLISQFVLNYKCSEIDRKKICEEISKHFDMHMYTTSDTGYAPKIINHGIADSHAVTPIVYNQSKINLNITMRNITSGIPQRVFDVLGCGGFLITNYQPEIAEMFEDGVDLVMYSSVPDLLDKIAYYLEHEDERKAIALNGYNKVMAEHTCEKRLEQMLSIL